MIARTIFILIGLYYCQSLWADCFGDGQEAVQSGDFDEAIVQFTECIDTVFLPEGRKVSSFIFRGISYQEKGQGNLAIQDYTSAIKLNPDYAPTYNNRGIAYNAAGRHDLAIRDYTQAIKLNRSYPKAYNNRGNSYHDKGQEDLAIKDYTRAIELDRSYVDAYMNRGESYSGSGQNDLAIKDYTKAIELDPQHAAAYLQRSVSYKNAGQNDRARLDYEQAIALAPSAAGNTETVAALPATAEPVPATAEPLPTTAESLPTANAPRGRSVSKDTVPPEISVRRGANVVSTSRYTVSGQATDKSGVGIVEVNGREAQLDEDGNFSASIILKPGSNEIEVVAIDINNNQSMQLFSIRREAGEVATTAVVASEGANDIFDQIVASDTSAAQAESRTVSASRVDSGSAADSRSASTGTLDLYDQLIKLDELRSRGILTEEEFSAAKALVLKKR